VLRPPAQPVVPPEADPPAPPVVPPEPVLPPEPVVPPEPVDPPAPLFAPELLFPQPAMAEKATRANKNALDCTGAAPSNGQL
jgi:WNK lysine deficient protein kinase